MNFYCFKIASTRQIITAVPGKRGKGRTLVPFLLKMYLIPRATLSENVFWGDQKRLWGFKKKSQEGRLMSNTLWTNQRR